jgi:hypothetical protein
MNFSKAVVSGQRFGVRSFAEMVRVFLYRNSQNLDFKELTWCRSALVLAKS